MKLHMTQLFTTYARAIIREIPRGSVTTYGIIADCAGNRQAARQVARILCSSSEKYRLPWHRVVNRNGLISPRLSMGHLLQRQLLEDEGIVVNGDGSVDLAIYLWQPEECFR